MKRRSSFWSGSGSEALRVRRQRFHKQLHLVKEPAGQGTYKYAVSHSRAHLNIADKLRTIFHESITSVEAAQNIVVFKTLAGLAGGACEALDHMDINGIVIRHQQIHGPQGHFRTAAPF